MAETESTSGLQKLLGELKERRVMRAATLYVIFFWPVIQIADILSPAMDIPPEAMRYLLIAFVVGLPVAVLLSWLFDLNRAGVVRAGAGVETAAAHAAQRPLLGRRVERAIIGVLLFVIAVLFYFQYWSGADVAPPPVASPEPQREVRALAVLPFASFSEKREDQFFADGLTEELLNVLSKLKDLQVIARTTAFAYKGVNRDVREIGLELAVDTILEGSVRRNDIDDTIRVTAQLIEVETGAHIWSQSFDREYRDVFRIQDEIANAVADQLQVTLLTGDASGLRASPDASPETLVVLSMGRAELAKRTPEGFEDALRFFERAVALSPAEADAHAELAKTHALIYSYGNTAGDHLLQADRAVSRALELDPLSAEAWAAQGLVHLQRKDDAAAAAALEKALALNASHAMAQMWMGELQTDPAQRLAFHQRAYALDPRSPVAAYNVANDLFHAGRDAEAMDVFDQLIEADPYYPMAYDLAARIDERHGRLAAAVPNYLKAFELSPQGHVARRLAALYIDLGDFPNAEQWLDAAERNGADASDLYWLRVSRFAAQGAQEQVTQYLRAMLDLPRGSATAHANATTAAYYLRQPQDAVAAWEQYVALYPEWTKAGKLELEAAVAAASAYRSVGAAGQSEAILNVLNSWIDERMSGGRFDPHLWYAKAQLFAIQGETGAALVHVQHAIDEGWRQHWRPAVEPCMEALLAIETFQSMMVGLAARMDVMGEQLKFDSIFVSAGAARRG